MSRSLWRCQDRHCRTVLGQVTNRGGLVLDPEVQRFAVYMDTRRAVIACPACGTVREFRGASLTSRRWP